MHTLGDRDANAINQTLPGSKDGERFASCLTKGQTARLPAYYSLINQRILSIASYNDTTHTHTERERESRG